MGINEILGNALQLLSDENTLLSWTIYHKISGHISVKIKFKQAEDSSRNNEGIHYKRKSINQVNRDRERGKAWRAAHQTIQPGANTYLEKHSHPGDIDMLVTAPIVTSPGESSAPRLSIQTRNMTRNISDSPENMRSHESTDCLAIDDIISPIITDTVLQDRSLLSMGSDTNNDDHAPSPHRPITNQVATVSNMSDVSGDEDNDIDHVDSSSISDKNSPDDDEGPPNCWFCWYYDHDPGKCHKHG